MTKYDSSLVKSLINRFDGGCDKYPHLHHAMVYGQEFSLGGNPSLTSDGPKSFWEEKPHPWGPTYEAYRLIGETLCHEEGKFTHELIAHNSVGWWSTSKQQSPDYYARSVFHAKEADPDACGYTLFRKLARLALEFVRNADGISLDWWQKQLVFDKNFEMSREDYSHEWMVGLQLWVRETEPPTVRVRGENVRRFGGPRYIKKGDDGDIVPFMIKGKEDDEQRQYSWPYKIVIGPGLRDLLEPENQEVVDLLHKMLKEAHSQAILDDVFSASAECLRWLLMQPCKKKRTRRENNASNKGGRLPITLEDASKRLTFCEEVKQKKMDKGTPMKVVAEKWGLNESEGKAWVQWGRDQQKTVEK